jgi:hypothetical protein
LNDVRHAERSSAARSASVVRSTQRSYAKFGAPLVVARYFDIASSHTSGRWRNVAGAMSVDGSPHVHRLHDAADQPHVVEGRQPEDAVVACPVSRHAVNHARVVEQILVREHHAARLARRTRRVLQHRQVGTRTSRERERRRVAPQLADVEPSHLRRRVAEREPALEARGERRVHERHACARSRR